MVNKVQFGISQVHTAAVTETLGVTTYETPTKIPGAVSMTATPNNTEVKFEADNDPNYFATFANDGYGIELAMALVPDDFKVSFLGYKKDEAGLIAEDTAAVTKPLALLFQIDGDTESVRCVYYKCVPGRPTLSPKTGKTPEAQTVPITVGKPVDSNYSFAYARKSENPAAYEAWFTTVQKYTEGV